MLCWNMNTWRVLRSEELFVLQMFFSVILPLVNLSGDCGCVSFLSVSIRQTLIPVCLLIGSSATSSDVLSPVLKPDNHACEIRSLILRTDRSQSVLEGIQDLLQKKVSTFLYNKLFGFRDNYHTPITFALFLVCAVF